MKKRIFFIPIIILLLVVSSYRFVQVNKGVSAKNTYKEVKDKKHFNINGIDFKINKSEILYDEDESGFLGIKAYIEMYKDGEIVQDGFLKKFPQSYFDEIILSVTDTDGTLMASNSWEIESYNKDNDNIKEIKNGHRNIGKEKESLILTFRFNKEIIEGVKNSKYYAKLGFPRDQNGMKVDYVKLNIY